MGKLHTLRRAIHRDPESFLAVRYVEQAGVGKYLPAPSPAWYDEKARQWHAARGQWNKSYRAFVGHVLKSVREVGMPDGGQGGTAT